MFIGKESVQSVNNGDIRLKHGLVLSYEHAFNMTEDRMCEIKRVREVTHDCV